MEYWIIYRGPGFLVLWFRSCPTYSFLSCQQAVYVSQSSCVSPVQLTDGRVERVGRSQIIRRRESLVIYKSFNTLCYCPRKNVQNVFELPPLPPSICLYGILVPFLLSRTWAYLGFCQGGCTFLADLPPPPPLPRSGPGSGSASRFWAGSGSGLNCQKIVV